MIEANFTIQDKQIANKRIVANAFTQLEDGNYHLEIKPRNIRSNQQSRYYWGCMIPMVFQGLIEVGYNEVKTFNDTHEIIKSLFLKKKIANENGPELELNLSTTSLTTIEFNLLIEQIQQWAAEFLGIYIPSPNEQLTIL